MRPRTSVREARRNISKILRSGETVSIGPEYGSVRGFIVGVPEHNAWNPSEKRAALKTARAAFLAAWTAEYKD